MPVKRRILIADDALIIRVMLKDILESYGYNVAGVATNKDEAVSQYKILKPDVVFMDIVLDPAIPFGGIEAIKEILEFDSKARIVIISAVEQERLLDKAARLGIKQYISKPFNESSVLAALESVLKPE